MSANKIDLIRQALNASESSIKLAKQLLGELESEKKINLSKNKSADIPGVLGIFDGKNMVTEKGETFPVPENYASKSILVVGDTLKLVEVGKEKRFKQIEHVKRYKSTGIIAKKDGKWTAVTPEGSYKLIGAAVEHFGGKVGDEVLIQIPAANLQSTWAAVEKVMSKDKGKTKISENKHETEILVKKEEPKHTVKEVKVDAKISEKKTKVEMTDKPKIQPKQIPDEPANVESSQQEQKTPTTNLQSPTVPIENQSSDVKGEVEEELS